jgi:hypothetical protein
VLSLGRYDPPSPLLDSHDSMVCPVLRVEVKAADVKKKTQINAAFSMSAAVSVISERLATRIGLVFDKTDLIDIVSPRHWRREAYLPASCLNVECMSDILSFRPRSDCSYLERPALQVAPVVCPSMTIDLLLGRDWFQHFSGKTNVIYGPGDGSSQIRCASGMNIAMPWGKLDCSPTYNRHTSYMDHILLTSDEVLSRLDDIRGYTSIESSAEGCSLRGVMLDPVMRQHDLPARPQHPPHYQQRDTGGAAQAMAMAQTQTQTQRQEPDDDCSGISEDESVGGAQQQQQSALYPWEEYATPAGDVYYYNSETGESSWDIH